MTSTGKSGIISLHNCVIKSLNETDGGNVGGLVGLFQGVAKEEADKIAEQLKAAGAEVEVK